MHVSWSGQGKMGPVFWIHHMQVAVLIVCSLS